LDGRELSSATDEDARELASALHVVGLSAPVQRDLWSLTASFDGGAFYALLITLGPGVGIGWAAYCKSLGTELGKEHAKGLPGGLKSIFGSRRVVIEEPDVMRIHVTPDVPVEAFGRLSLESPDASVQELEYDVHSQRWRDPMEQWKPPQSARGPCVGPTQNRLRIGPDHLRLVCPRTTSARPTRIGGLDARLSRAMWQPPVGGLGS